MEAENNYDLNALYLIKNDWGYRGIEHIRKINEKSIIMSNGTKVLKNEFQTKCYKLNEEEVQAYRKEFIKTLTDSPSYKEIKYLIISLEQLKEVLNFNEFIELDTEKLQKRIDYVTNVISEHLAKSFKVNGVEFKFDDKTLKFNDETLDTIE